MQIARQRAGHIDAHARGIAVRVGHLKGRIIQFHADDEGLAGILRERKAGPRPRSHESARRRREGCSEAQASAQHVARRKRGQAALTACAAPRYLARLMSKIVGIDLGTTNSLAGVMDAGFPVLIADAEGRRLTPSRRSFSRRGPSAVGRCGGEAHSRAQAARDRFLDQAIHGPPRQRAVAGGDDRQLSRRRAGERAGARGDAGPRLVAGGDFGRGAEEAQGRRGAFAGRAGDAGGHHRSRLFQRRAAQRDQGSGPAGGAGGRAHRQRADGRGAGLRAGPAEAEIEDRGLRPRRRHVRHFHPRIERGRLPGAGDERQHAARRRRHRRGADRRTGPASRGRPEDERRYAGCWRACTRRRSRRRSGFRPSRRRAWRFRSRRASGVFPP